MPRSIRLRTRGLAVAVAALFPSVAAAHDPVFGLGPRTLYQGG